MRSDQPAYISAPHILAFTNHSPRKMPKARLVPAAVIDFDQIAISTSPPRPTNIAVTGRINRSAGASSDVHARMLRLLAVEGVRPSSISRRHRLRRSQIGRAHV